MTDDKRRPVDVDTAIADRLSKSRSSEDGSTIAERLESKLDGSSLYRPTSGSKINVNRVKTKSSQQLADDLILQYADERRIDDSKNSIDDVLANRLRALRTENCDTENPSDQKHICSESYVDLNNLRPESSSQSTDDFIKQCIQEMEDKKNKKKALKKLQYRCSASENENNPDENLRSVIAEVLSDTSDDDFYESSTSSSDEIE